MDLQLFRAINELPEWLGPAMRFFSQATDYLWFKLLLVSLIGWMLWRGGKARLAAIQALIAFPLANGATDLFKHYLPDERPCNFLSDWAFHGIGCSESMGTASAHSANMAAVAFVFTYQLGWWGLPWIAISFLTGFSRVYCGAHYPHQVMLGWFCGVFAALVVTKTWEVIAKKRAPVIKEQEREEP